MVLARAAAAAQSALGPGERLLIYKNNSDGKGNSYGAHENYLVARGVPFGDIVAHLTAFLVTRQVFCGAGKVGSENGRPAVPFQLSQRADFFEEEVGLETTLKRPIVNTRDEPHADPARYRRLHVIPGDANLSEKQIFLKLGSTALVLAALEAGALGPPLVLEDPVGAMWRVSHDPGLRRTVRLAGLTTVPAEDVLIGAGGMTPGAPENARGTMLPKLREEGLCVVHAGGTAGLFSGILEGWGPNSNSRITTREVRN